LSFFIISIRLALGVHFYYLVSDKLTTLTSHFSSNFVSNLWILSYLVTL